MATTVKVQDLVSIGNVTDGDYFVGERIAGTTGKITFNGVVYDADFTSNGLMTRTAAGTYANRTLTGVSNRTTITNGDGVSGNPTVDISSSYVGQNTITTLGTVATGTWNASTISMSYGGTGNTLVASNGGIVYSSATRLEILSGTPTAQQILMAGSSTTPAWSTATYPPTTTINRILYSSANNVVGQITSAASSVLITNGSSVPSLSTTLPSGLNATSMNLITPALGTPSAGVLSNCSGYPLSQLTGLGTNIGTFLATPSSANLISAITDETGTGALVFANTPTLVTPVLGAATATSINFGGSTLSNYATGTFTPTITSSGGGTCSYSLQAGKYTRIGDQVQVSIYIILSSIASLNAGSLQIAGLPITPVSTTSMNIHPEAMAATATSMISGITNNAVTTVTLYKFSAGTNTTLDKADITNTSVIICSGMYSV